MTDEKHYVLCFWEDYYEVHGPYDSADPLNAYGNWCEEKNSKDENWSTWFGMKANDPQPLAVYAPDLGDSTLKKSQGGLGDYIVVWEWTHGLGYELFGPCDDAGAFGEEWQAYHGDCPCWQPVTLQNPFAAPRVVSPSAEDQRAAERAYWSKRLEAAKRELKVAEARVDQCKQRIAHTELQSLAQ